MSSKGNCIKWKMRNERSYRDLFTELPQAVLHIRDQLRRILNIDNIPSVELVVYKGDDSGETVGNPEHESRYVALSDYYLLEPFAQILVGRMPKEQAEAVIQQANASAIAKPFSSDSEPQKVHIPKNLVSAQVISSSTATKLLCSSRDDEDAKLLAVMEQHSFHRGPLSRSCDDSATLVSVCHDPRNQNLTKFSRTKNWTWNKADGELVPPPSIRRGLNSNTALPRSAVKAGLETVNIVVHSDYICHMCGMKGHHIRNCDKTNKTVKRIRPATGIPANFLTRICPEDICKHSSVYVLRDGNFAIMKNIEAVSGGAYFSTTFEQKIEKRLGKAGRSRVGCDMNNYLSKSDGSASDSEYQEGRIRKRRAVGKCINVAQLEHSSGLHEDLRCPLCKCFFSSPTIMLCCGETLCRECIRSGEQCRLCHRGFANSNNMSANTAIQECLDAIIGCRVSFSPRA